MRCTLPRIESVVTAACAPWWARLSICRDFTEAIDNDVSDLSRSFRREVFANGGMELSVLRGRAAYFVMLARFRWPCERMNRRLDTAPSVQGGVGPPFRAWNVGRGQVAKVTDFDGRHGLSAWHSLPHGASVAGREARYANPRFDTKPVRHGRNHAYPKDCVRSDEPLNRRSAGWLVSRRRTERTCGTLCFMAAKKRTSRRSSRSSTRRTARQQYWAAVGDDGTRPVVWGLGGTSAAALRDARTQLRQADAGSELSTSKIAKAQDAHVRAGDVSWPIRVR